MSSHYLSSQYGGSHYLSNHFGRGVVEVEEDGSTAGLGYQAELRRRKRRDDDDLITIITAFMQIKDD